eukprot:UN04642
MQIHIVLPTPLTFPISQRVLKIFYRFWCKSYLIFIADSFPIKFLVRQNILKIPRKNVKNDENCNFFTFSNTFTAFANAYNHNLFVNSNSLDKIEYFCTK